MAQLTGSVTIDESVSVNLTSEGTTDWAHWTVAQTAPNVYKATGGQTISALNSTPSGNYNDDTRTFSWSDGQSGDTSGSDTDGIYEAGYELIFTVPASTSVQRLRVYCGVYNATAQLSATLSDGSAAEWSDDTTLTASGASAHGVVQLDFAAASAGKTLTFTIVKSGSGNVSLSSATLQPEPSGGDTGTGTPTEGADIAAGTGSLSVTGSGSPAEGADTAAGSGALSVTGSGSPAEAADTASGTGSAGGSGSGAIMEGADTASGTGSLRVSGSGTIAEGSDAAVGTGTLSGAAIGSGSPTEGQDQVAGAGSLSIIGRGAPTEGADISAGTGVLPGIGPVMPTLIGLLLSEAEAAMQAAGVLVPSAIGYFGTWPITVRWQTPADARDEVLSQSIAAGTPTKANSPITLGVRARPTGVVYP